MTRQLILMEDKTVSFFKP